MKTVERVREHSLRSVEWLSKGSYLAKAVLYAAIAVFTLGLALGSQTPDPGRKQVLEQFSGHWGGKVLLAFITLSLLGHTIWRLSELWNDPYEKGKGPMGWIYRLNYLLSGITYAALGWTAVKLLLGGGSGQDNQKQIWAAKLLQIEGGMWLIILVGCLIWTWAGLQFYKGLSGCVFKSLEIDKANRWACRILRVSSLVGFVTLGTTLAGTGWYLIKGAWTQNPKWIKNMDDLVKSLQALPGGWHLQLIVAMGFLLMAVFMLAMARYFPLKTQS